MTEEEFVALLAIEGKKLVVDRTMARGSRKNLYTPVAYYAAHVHDPKNVALVEYTKQYRSRGYAVQKMIKDYYANN